MLQIPRSAPVADVVIIGSGAGGGTVTKVLADLGINVTLLEAGPMLHPEIPISRNISGRTIIRIGDRAKAARATSGGAAISAGFRRMPADGNWKASRTLSRRIRNSAGSGRAFVGGRTNHYGRISLRYADYDLKPYSRDGIGTDWPISYDEIAPYYDKAETFIGVTGSKEGLAQRARRKISTLPAAARA